VDSSTVTVKLQKTTLSINFVSVREVDKSGRSVLSYLLPSSTISVFNANNSFSLVSYLIGNNSTLNISYNTFTTGQTLTFAKQNISLPPNALKLTLSISNWKFSNTLNQIFIDMRVCEQLKSDSDCSGSMGPSSYYWTKDLSHYTFYVNYARNGIVDGSAAKVGTVYNQTSQTTTLIIPHFFEYAILDPDFSALVNANPPSHINMPKIIGITIGVIVGVVVLIVLLYLLVNRLKFKRIAWRLQRNSLTVTHT